MFFKRKKVLETVEVKPAAIEKTASLELKIKSKHLSLESKVIRHEEHKLKKQLRWMRDHQKHIQDIGRLSNQLKSIQDHRRWDVRNENRATFLARAYLAGIPYNKVEQKRNESKELVFKNFVTPRVAAMVSKYGSKPVSWETIMEWAKL